MVTHPGFGITTQEIDQHQEEIQVNHFQSSISQFIQKKIANEFKRVFICSYICSCCQIDLLRSIGKKTNIREGTSISLLMSSSQ